MLGHDVDLAEVEEKLVGWLQGKMPGASDLVISDLERSGAGFTNVSIPFTLRWREGGEERSRGLLFRGAGTSSPVYPDPKLERQFRVMQCLQHTDVPVPRVYWMEQDERLFGFPFYLMRRIDGVVPSEFPPYHSFGLCYDASPEQRARMWWGAIEAIVRVHQADWKRLGLSFLGAPPEGAGALDGELAYWEHYLEWAKEEPQPILEAALEWLRAGRYAPARVTLCWGDARLPNTIFDESGNLLALLDWDMAILSDPESDLAFFIALDHLLGEGIGVPRLDGFPGPEETVARYEQLTGWRVEHLFYNEVFATFRTGVVVLKVQKNLLQMGVELPGEDPILDNMCTRRLAELLALPSPAASRVDVRAGERVSGTVQVHLTGPGGGPWYIVANQGRVTRHRGETRDATATVTVAAEDWAAILRGELNTFNAWTTGALKVTGDSALYQQLADAITKVWDEKDAGRMKEGRS